MIYVMSDIHGNMRRFRSIMKKIELQPEDELYVLGDVIDRHPDGIEILQEIMAMPNARMLLGNHEYMMLNALVPYDQDLPWMRRQGLSDLNLWYRNHGEITEVHFKALSKEEQQRIFDYLKSLPLNIDIEVNGKKYKLVHGAPVEFFPEINWKYHDETQFAVWERIEDHIKIPDDYTLIYGHTPTLYYAIKSRLSIWHGQNRIAIDCGSGFEDIAPEDYPHQGRLACLRLDDMKEFYSKEKRRTSKGDEP